MFDFESLSSAWNEIKTLKAPEFKQAIPGLVKLNAVILKRVSEDAQFLTVEFRGISSAVVDPNTNVPLLNRAILNWLRNVSKMVQTVRGAGENSLIVRIARNTGAAENMNQTTPPSPKYEHRRIEIPRAAIISTRFVEGN